MGGGGGEPRQSEFQKYTNNLVFSFPLRKVVPSNVKFLLILQWISNDFQGNVLTFLENWCSHAERGKGLQKDDLLRRRDTCKRNRSWTGQLGGKQQLEVGGQAGFHEQGLCLWEKALGVASSFLQCPSWSLWFMGPDQLSQCYHLLSPQSLGMKKWTHVIAPYSPSNTQCRTTSSFCPLVSALRSAWARASWSVRPTRRVCQGGNIKVFPRFWWGFLGDKVKKRSTRQPPISSCVGCPGSVYRINSKYYWQGDNN